MVWDALVINARNQGLRNPSPTWCDPVERNASPPPRNLFVDTGKRLLEERKLAQVASKSIVRNRELINVAIRAFLRDEHGIPLRDRIVPDFVAIVEKVYVDHWTLKPKVDLASLLPTHCEPTACVFWRGHEVS